MFGLSFAKKTLVLFLLFAFAKAALAQSDVLEVRIVKITDSAGNEISKFSKGQQINVWYEVINHSGSDVIASSPSVTIRKYIDQFPPGGGSVAGVGGTTYTPGTSPPTFVPFTLTNATNGAYEVKTAIEVKPTETSFYLNNSDEKFLTLASPESQVVSVPETDFFLVPIVALAVLALVGSKKISHGLMTRLK